MTADEASLGWSGEATVARAFVKGWLVVACISCVPSAVCASAPFGIDRHIHLDNSSIWRRHGQRQGDAPAGWVPGTGVGIGATHPMSPWTLGWLPGSSQAGIVHRL